MMRRLILLWVLALLGMAALVLANLFLGNLNQDEGWYLYAARLVAQGQLPYRDFAFTQAPLLPLVYAWIQPWIDVWGLAAGRVFTALLGLGAALFAALLAARLVGRCAAAAALICFVLIMLNVYQSYYFTMVKTYALTAFFLTLGLLVLSWALSRRSSWLALGAGVLLLLAGATRTSAGLVLPLVIIMLFWARRRLAFQAWAFLILGGLLAAAITLAPFALLAPEAARFFLWDYHLARTAGSLGQSLTYKAGFSSRLLQGYFVAVALWLTVLFGRWLTRGRPAAAVPSEPTRLMIRMLWASLAAVSLVHFLAPFPYEDYQVFVYPLFATLVAAMAVAFIADHISGWGLALLILLLSSGAALSSPLNQDWFVLGRDRIWWHLKEQSALRQLQSTAALLRSISPAGSLLLTQDPYLAVESGLNLPPGLEMGQFSYFPGLSQAQAARLHVLNRSSFESLLLTCPAPLAAISGYAFAISSPAVEPLAAAEQSAFESLLAARYELIGEVADFGQASTTLRIFKRKAAL